MVDKVWYDWQIYDPANKNVFSGGSIAHTHNTSDFDMFPVGGPPDLNVSRLFFRLANPSL